MQSMGIAPLGVTPNLQFKRKYRWTFEATFPCGVVKPQLVKIAARPVMPAGEEEIDFLAGKTWIPGKGTGDSITTTAYEPEKKIQDQIIQVLAACYDFCDPAKHEMTPERIAEIEAKSGEGKLVLYDGCGSALEDWTLHKLWPMSFNLGELDYSSSDEVTLEIKWSYKAVTYKSRCEMPPMTTASLSDPKPQNSPYPMGLGPIGDPNIVFK